MHILYIGPAGGTSLQRAKALERLGHQVAVFDPHRAMRFGRLDRVFHLRTGYAFFQRALNAWIRSLEAAPNIVWVDHGSLLGRKAVTLLKERFSCPVILYSIDDPTGNRDGRRFASMLKAIPEYHACVVMREFNVLEFKARGAKSVLRVMMSCDEVAHQPFANPMDLPDQFRSEVAFLGTWMPREGRDEFLLGLIERGLDVSIWGDRWHKSPAWDRIKPHWRGPGLVGRDYVAAIQGAKVCIGLLSRGNRDQHTTRSTEIPFAGGVLCAERTPEHQAMYRECEEAMFWDDVAECAGQCKRLLDDVALREHIRAAGARRVRALGLTNESVCRRIVDWLHAELDLNSEAGITLP